MSLVLGTNVGFVSTAPTADPAGSDVTIDGSSVVVKHTSPAGNNRITEVGWYRGAGTDTANFEIALYAEGSGVAATRLFVDASNSSSVQGWVIVAVDWPISASTAYWLGVQMDAHTGTSSIDSATSGGAGIDVRTSQTTLNDPYGGGAVSDADGMYAVYALYEAIPLISTLSDNFDDNSLDATKWVTDNASSGSTAETSNKIVATPANSTAGSQAGIISPKGFNLTASSAQVQVVQAADTTNVYTNFELWLDANNYIAIGVGAGDFEYYQNVAGSFSVPFTVAYDSSVHKYWRLRESGGKIYADYSVDSVTWINYYQATNPIAVTNLKVRLFCYEHTSDATPGAAQFDNFNILTSGTAISNLSDNFDDNSIDTTKWNEFEQSSGTVTESGSQLNYSLANSTAGSWSGLHSKVQYNFIGGQVSIKAIDAVGGNSWFDLTLSTEQLPNVDNFFSIGVDTETGMLQALKCVGDVDFILDEIAFNATDHLYWRIRESGGTIYWEYSANGTSWTELYSSSSTITFPITNLYVVLDDDEHTSSTGNVHAFDDFNILPSSTVVKDIIGGGIIPFAR